MHVIALLISLLSMLLLVVFDIQEERPSGAVPSLFIIVVVTLQFCSAMQSFAGMLFEQGKKQEQAEDGD
jgi:hypothetical protein